MTPWPWSSGAIRWGPSFPHHISTSTSSTTPTGGGSCSHRGATGRSDCPSCGTLSKAESLLLLAIESSTLQASVALATEDGVLASARLVRPRRHAEYCIPALDFCLR